VLLSDKPRAAIPERQAICVPASGTAHMPLADPSDPRSARRRELTHGRRPCACPALPASCCCCCSQGFARHGALRSRRDRACRTWDRIVSFFCRSIGRRRCRRLHRPRGMQPLWICVGSIFTTGTMRRSWWIFYVCVCVRVRNRVWRDCALYYVL